MVSFGGATSTRAAGPASLALLVTSDVLPGERLNCTRPGQADHPHLLVELLEGHLVQFFDGNLWIFFPVLHEHDSSTGPERLADLGYDLERIRKLVVDIDHEHDIYSAGRQFGVVFSCLHLFDVGYFHCGGALSYG